MAGLAKRGKRPGIVPAGPRPPVPGDPPRPFAPASRVRRSIPSPRPAGGPMSVLRSFAAALAALVPLACLAPAPAAAETLTCTNITVLPASITVPGHYCINQKFAQNFTTAAFNIGASNVVLDCNDHAVVQTGTAAVSGVYVTNKSQVTVRNCALDGFGRGISFFETTAGLSRNNRVVDNEVRRSRLSGIQMAGSANLVDGNRVTENLGGTSAATYGILLTS